MYVYTTWPCTYYTTGTYYMYYTYSTYYNTYYTYSTYYTRIVLYILYDESTWPIESKNSISVLFNVF